QWARETELYRQPPATAEQSAGGVLSFRVAWGGRRERLHQSRVETFARQGGGIVARAAEDREILDREAPIEEPEPQPPPIEDPEYPDDPGPAEDPEKQPVREN